MDMIGIVKCSMEFGIILGGAEVIVGPWGGKYCFHRVWLPPLVPSGKLVAALEFFLHELLSFGGKKFRDLR